MDIKGSIKEAFHELGLGGNRQELETAQAEVARLTTLTGTQATDIARLTAENQAFKDANAARLTTTRDAALTVVEKAYPADPTRLAAIKDQINAATELTALESSLALFGARDKARRAVLAAKGQGHADLPAIQQRIEDETNLTVLGALADVYAPAGSAAANLAKQTQNGDPAVNKDEKTLEDSLAAAKADGEKANAPKGKGN